MDIFERYKLALARVEAAATEITDDYNFIKIIQAEMDKQSKGVDYIRQAAKLLSTTVSKQQDFVNAMRSFQLTLIELADETEKYE